MSFRLEMTVRGFFKHQKIRSDTDGYDGYFSNARVFQVKVNTMKRIFQQWSELQVAEWLIVHVLSSRYNVFTFELQKEKKATQQWNLRFTNDIVLN